MSDLPGRWHASALGDTSSAPNDHSGTLDAARRGDLGDVDFEFGSQWVYASAIWDSTDEADIVFGTVEPSSSTVIHATPGLDYGPAIVSAHDGGWAIAWFHEDAEDTQSIYFSLVSRDGATGQRIVVERGVRSEGYMQLVTTPRGYAVVVPGDTSHNNTPLVVLLVDAGLDETQRIVVADELAMHPSVFVDSEGIGLAYASSSSTLAFARLGLDGVVLEPPRDLWEATAGGGLRSTSLVMHRGWYWIGFSHGPRVHGLPVTLEGQAAEEVLLGEEPSRVFDLAIGTVAEDVVVAWHHSGSDARVNYALLRCY